MSKAEEQTLADIRSLNEAIIEGLPNISSMIQVGILGFSVAYVIGGMADVDGVSRDDLLKQFETCMKEGLRMPMPAEKVR